MPFPEGRTLLGLTRDAQTPRIIFPATTNAAGCAKGPNTVVSTEEIENRGAAIQTSSSILHHEQTRRVLVKIKCQTLYNNPKQTKWPKNGRQTYQHLRGLRFDAHELKTDRARAQ